MPVRERIIEQMEHLGEAELPELEREIRERTSQAKVKRRLEALYNVAGILSDPEDYAEFEKHARRRATFGVRTLDPRPDKED